MSFGPFPVEPVYKFISGGAGARKSYLIKALYQTALKTFGCGPFDPQLPHVLKIAPTGVAAININGLVINSALAILKDQYGEYIGSLPHERLSILRYKLKDLKLIIMNEISMVSNKMLKHIHERLKQIFGTPDSMLFAGISLIAVGDLYQLPPIKVKHVFSDYKNECFNLCHPWRLFQIIELDQTMCQQGDNTFTGLLNRVRTCTGTPSDEDCEILSERIVSKSDDNYCKEAIHIWEENQPVDAHDEEMLDMINENLVTIIAHDVFPSSVSVHDINKTLKRGRCSNAGLAYTIKLKVGARVMLTTNLDVEDRLINGQIGTVLEIKNNRVSCKPEVIHVKFDDQNAG